MKKKRINCQSCETKTDIIVWESNIPEDEVEFNYCPVCSADLEDFDSYATEDEE
jgi:uncharacterized protein CbrC (UPF0167 family)